MSIDNYISLTVIIDRVMMNPGMEDLPYDLALTTVTDTIRLIAIPLFLINNDAYGLVEDYRGLLPYGYVEIKKIDRVNTEREDNNRSPLTINQDPFYQSYSYRDQIRENPSGKYKIQGDYVYTSFETGKLHVAYNTIPVDSEGVVMIPDRVSIIKALEFSLLATWYQKKWFLGIITADKFDWADRQRNWYISQAGTDFAMENLDKRQTLSNIINTLILNDEHGKNDFTALGDKEYRKRYI